MWSKILALRYLISLTHWRESADCCQGNGGAVASWLVRSSPDRAVQVRALTGEIVLCSQARHFTLAVHFSTQVYKWVPANLMLRVTLRWTNIPSRGGSRNTPSGFMLQKAEISAGLMGHLARMQTLPKQLDHESTINFPLTDRLFSIVIS